MGPRTSCGVHEKSGQRTKIVEKNPQGPGVFISSQGCCQSSAWSGVRISQGAPCPLPTLRCAQDSAGFRSARACLPLKLALPPWQESPYILASCRCAKTILYFAEATGLLEGTLGKSILPSLQSRTGGKIGRCLYVRADCRHQAAAKIGGTANVFLSAVFCLFGHGASSGGRAQYRRLGHDPRPGRFGPGSE